MKIYMKYVQNFQEKIIKSISKIFKMYYCKKYLSKNIYTLFYTILDYISNNIK